MSQIENTIKLMKRKIQEYELILEIQQILSQSEEINAYILRFEELAGNLEEFENRNQFFEVLDQLKEQKARIQPTIIYYCSSVLKQLKDINHIGSAPDDPIS